MLTLPELARRRFGRESAALTRAERHVLQSSLSRRPIARNAHEAYVERLSFGERLADGVARVGGSWHFIIGFGLFLALWVLVNRWLAGSAFDPYPFIFLNLVLSMLAAVQAPIIMMSQNRQVEHDRIDAGHDYEVNLKAEIEIMGLHDKLDQLRNEQLVAILTRIEALAADLHRMERAREGAADAPTAPEQPQG